MGITLLVVGLVIVFALISAQQKKSPAAVKAREEKAEREKKILCQFCQTSGHVTTSMHKKKQGVSGGKATGAVLTGGFSLLATGLARKGWVTSLWCRNCGMRWDVEA